ncbi:MAG: hypothetical protein ACO1QB_16500 [Verrucomicrobiales bacterium]
MKTERQVEDWETIYGGIDIEVHRIGKTSGTTAPMLERVKVMKIALKDMGWYAAQFGKIKGELPFYVQKPPEWFDTLLDDSVDLIMREGRRLNKKSLQSIRKMDEPIKTKRASTEQRTSLLEVFEFLLSQGHRESEMFEYSPDKLMLFAELATSRKTREAALQGISNMKTAQAAFASVMSKGGDQLFKSTLKELQGLAGFKPNSKANLASLKQKLKNLGAKVD